MCVTCCSFDCIGCTINSNMALHIDGEHILYYNRSYRIQITMTGCIITRYLRQIKRTPITTEQYVREQLIKTSRHIDSGDDIFKSYQQARCESQFNLYILNRQLISNKQKSK